MALKEQVKRPVSKDSTLSLAPESIAPYNITYKLQLFSDTSINPSIPEQLHGKEEIVACAVIITPTDTAQEKYVLISKWLPQPPSRSASKNTYICRHQNAFAITNGTTWHWLEKGKSSNLLKSMQII